MLKYVLLFAISINVCVRARQSDIKQNKLSFCNADPPEEIDSSPSGNIQYSTAEKPRSWIIKVNEKEDDGILVKVSSFELVQSFLVIRDDHAAGSGKIQFVSGKNSKSFITFFIPYSKSFYMEVCPEDTGRGDKVEGVFAVSYERSVPDYGEGPLPGEPQEIEREKQAVEVQFKGKAPEAFRDDLFVRKFEETVKYMARDYCLENNISFDMTKPAEEMVIIHNVHRCPIEWGERDKCASIHHSVFVSGEDDNNGGRIWDYQLSRSNLQKMWDSATNDYLKNIDLMIYTPPDRTVVIGNWFAMVVLPFIILIALLYLLRITYIYVVKDIHDGSFTVAEAADVEKRKKSKLKPNKYQQMPSFIEEEETVAAGSVTPGKMLQTQQNSYSAALLFPRLRMEGIPE